MAALLAALSKLAAKLGAMLARRELAAALTDPERAKRAVQLIVAIAGLVVGFVVLIVGFILIILGGDFGGGGCTFGGGSGGGSWLATAYGPPWGGIEGDGVTATGLDLTGGPANVYEVAVDPNVIPLRSYVHVTPNPFGVSNAFYAGDTGGAVVGKHVDIYDWRGQSDMDTWGRRQVDVTPAADPGAGNALGQVQAPAQVDPTGTCASPDGLVNPFAQTVSVSPDRVDMGVDYFGVGPILAMGNGVVTFAQADDPGWGPFGCAGGHAGAIVYRLTDPGPNNGRYIYVTEGITPLVSGAQQLQAGQVIGMFTGCIEIGWASGSGGSTMAAALNQECGGSDPGCHSTFCGAMMSQAIAATGGPAGQLQDPNASQPPQGIYGPDTC